MIKTVSSIDDVLRNHNTKEWVKNANLDRVNFSKLNEMVNTPSSVSDNKKTFSEILSESIGEVNNLQKEADKAIQRLITGESKNIHETVLAVEKADIAFRTMNQIRMKVIDAYKEVMKMQV